ncbi:putative membrane protein YphA (DoxX/SURF4 family) [Pedobacter sp. AK017]|uniref:MauE/DoxX family redox-associated membrane protein n=1 Tax=Pedobacter sp. AK017 TaxID=2723073 RepID=UPI00160971B3|nr:MauE/DoxX family redox-associated membrane protein [Pedobacter sp. AK017]MBB5441379.1 putative membrane protein YphA (DoxX/SURF4 family) [Pedobacter sp. AK017]
MKLILNKRCWYLLLIDAIRYLFILLFLYAAFSKVWDFQKFKVQLGQSPILSDFTLLVALLVPAVEILIAAGLAFKRTLLPALWASYGLMIMFSLYIIVILKFSDRPVCHCGGVLEQMQWSEHLWFNVGFVGLGIAGLWLGFYRRFRDASTRHLEPQGEISCLGIVQEIPRRCASLGMTGCVKDDHFRHDDEVC